jgi:hypothetical protein
MSEIPPAEETRIYRIVVRGILDTKWSAWFDDFSIRSRGKHETVLLGSVRDQGELHGLLARIRDLNLTLISLEALPDETPADPGSAKPPITIL